MPSVKGQWYRVSTFIWSSCCPVEYTIRRQSRVARETSNHGNCPPARTPSLQPESPKYRRIDVFSSLAQILLIFQILRMPKFKFKFRGKFKWLIYFPMLDPLIDLSRFEKCTGRVSNRVFPLSSSRGISATILFVLLFSLASTVFHYSCFRLTSSIHVSRCFFVRIRQPTQSFHGI